MKTLGLLGGMSWQSTLTYYQIMNRAVAARMGGLHSADLLLASLDFAPLEKMQAAGDWAGASDFLVDKAIAIERAGAEGLMICTNTMHKVADDIAAAVSIPLLHIADATGKYLSDSGFQRAALLGTAFTMEQGFYKDRLRDRFALNVVIPNGSERALVHKTIYEELCVGQLNDRSRQSFVALIEALIERGAQAIILGCTEIGLLVKQSDTSAVLIDTTQIHALAGVDFMLSDQ
jgi:aspartate racemase